MKIEICDVSIEMLEVRNPEPEVWTLKGDGANWGQQILDHDVINSLPFQM